MDADRFDTITRALATPPTRRAILGLGLAGGLGSLRGRLDAAAKRKKRKKKKHKKKPCRATCDGKDCGSDGCGGSCGDCSDPLTCQAGQCACLDGKDFCGGKCLPPCPTSTPGRVIARHPASCACCVRPGSYPCPNNVQQCCDEPNTLPCCGPPCEPLAVDPHCQEALPCHYDVECFEGSYCGGEIDPRRCEVIPG